eukprot:960053-Pelagomonas_calceolata.AAC.1
MSASRPSVFSTSVHVLPLSPCTTRPSKPSDFCCWPRDVADAKDEGCCTASAADHSPAGHRSNAHNTMKCYNFGLKTQ